MAQYEIKYGCGHGSVAKQLFGKTSDRVQRLAWYERNLVCPECYKIQKQREDDSAEQVAFVETIIGQRVITVRIQGRVTANNDALKAMGFEWTQYYGGIGFYLATKEPPPALVISHKYTTPIEFTGWLTDLEIKLGDLGYVIRNNVSAIDYALWQKAGDEEAAKAREIAAKRAANPRPKRPDWYNALMTPSGSRCNGTLYGRKGNWRIYISNTEQRLTDDQAIEFEAYFKAFAAWKAIP